MKYLPEITKALKALLKYFAHMHDDDLILFRISLLF